MDYAAALEQARKLRPFATSILAAADFLEAVSKAQWTAESAEKKAAEALNHLHDAVAEADKVRAQIPALEAELAAKRQQGARDVEKDLAQKRALRDRLAAEYQAALADLKRQNERLEAEIATKRAEFAQEEQAARERLLKLEQAIEATKGRIASL